MNEQKDPAGNHFPDFHHQESRVAALEDAIRRLNAELRAQRAVNEAALDWFLGTCTPSVNTNRAIAALREALR